jgi:hypothetical protein
MILLIVTGKIMKVQEKLALSGWVAVHLVVCLAFVAFSAFSAAHADEQGSESFSFAVWGHPRASDGEPPVHFQELLDRLEALGPDLLIITGDAIHGMSNKIPDPEVIRGDWDFLYQGLDRLGIPIHVVPGNHDVNNFVTRDIFLERHQKPPYAFSFNRSRFLILDTVGIDQQIEDGDPKWDPQMLFFDDAQIRFIRSEIESEDEYDHIFLFMHHTDFWLDEKWPWWQKIHPILRGSKARVVFAGTPAYSKYVYFQRDGVEYIQSSFLDLLPIGQYHGYRDRWRFTKSQQFDNFQFVTVEADSYAIDTIVVGARSSRAFDPDWVRASEWPEYFREYMAARFHQLFPMWADLVLVAAIWGGICLLTGAFLAAGICGWLRRKPH